MTMNPQGRPTAPVSADISGIPDTFTGNRGLQIEEALLFEVGRLDVTGVDLDEPEAFAPRLGKLARRSPIDLPGLSEPETLRHYVRLSQKNYSIDAGLYPLGSCTMKHNPRLNEKMARLPGIGDIHPLQPLSTVQGAVELMSELGRWLLEMTGMSAVALSPKAGAHGELCGMMAIKAAILARGENRNIVLVPESAHGTNPATAAAIGFKVVTVPARADGTVDPAEVRKLLSPEVAAIMLTNPNTCGLFERDVVEIAAAIHEAGAYFYCDGANFNAIVGKAKVGELGVDAMHINLHKTFSTPHGGGGPGAGPVVLSSRLAAFAPLPFIRIEADGPVLVENETELQPGETPFGRMVAFHGQMGMFVRALSYMLSHGSDGLQQASEDAVLNANYIRVGLRDLMSQPSGDRTCMHEVLFDDSFLEGTGITTLDFAKAMIDEGYHPMTMYFPLVVHGAMLVEPTESESKASLDLFIATIRDLVMKAKSGDVERFLQAPRYAPRRRLDETKAARSPKLRWEKPEPWSEAAE
jgi:glycine dehydrogenase subunit 2